MANPTTLSLHGEVFVATARSGHWKFKVENPSSHHRWTQGYKATAFQPWSQDIPSHLCTTHSDVFRCPSPKTPRTCGLYGCDDLVAQHLAHLERWRTGLSKWLSGNGGIMVRKKWQIHGNPEKIDGLHALNCWTPRLDGFLWIRFGSIWITSSVSDLICCGHESRGPMFGVTPASVACPTDSSLPHFKDFQCTLLMYSGCCCCCFFAVPLPYG